MSLLNTRDLNRKLRSKIINPTVWKLQNYFWNFVRYLIGSNEIKSLDQLSELFNWKSIAIVWNSPCLETSWLWSKIDNYDIVVRFNRWILTSELDSENTWVKTDIWSTWMLDTLVSLNVINQISRTTFNINMLIPFPYEKNNYKGTAFNIAILEKLSPYRAHNKFYMSPSFYDDIYEEVWSEPSSWFILIKYISEKMMPSKIWIFWFTFSSNNRITWETYSDQHDFWKEEGIIKRLSAFNEKIRIY